MLIILSGLPGVGKTTLARALASDTGAVHLRIDTIEQALRSGMAPDEDVYDLGYRVGFALAGDLLKTGQTVIADSVNPVDATRSGWRSAATSAGASYLEFEVACSDQSEHRSRVETRTTDNPGQRLPSWDDVQARHYAAWTSDVHRLDTAGCTVFRSRRMFVLAYRNLLARDAAP